MKTVSNAFKQNLIRNGRQITAKIIYNNNVIDEDSINSLSITTNGSILKSVMTGVEISLDVNIPVLSQIEVQFGLLVNGEYNYISYGVFVVKTSEYDADTRSYKIIAYDKLMESMVKYDDDPLEIEYPITVKNYLSAICSKLGWELNTQEFANDNTLISSERYDGIGYTYRDILDDIAEVTASIICYRNNGLTVLYPTESNFTLDEEYLKDTNVTIKEKFGPINTIVLSRSAESDNIYYPEQLPETPIEYVIKDNELLNYDDRASFMPAIYNKLNGLEYYTYEFDTFGVCFMEVGDLFTINVNNTNYGSIILNDEIKITQSLEETLYVDLTERTNVNYSASSSDDKRESLIVDKMNHKIQGVVKSQNDLEGRVSQAEATLDDHSFQISIVSTNIDPETGDVLSVKTVNGYTFDENGLNISINENEYNALHNNTGSYYRDGNNILGETTKDGSKYKNMDLYGEWRYGKEYIDDDPMFVAELYTDGDGEQAFGHFYNGVD